MSKGKFSITADFLEVQERRLFYVLLTPTQEQAHSCILYLPPFAEEMHLSRRPVSLQARALAAQGYCVMLLDPTGCGDAAGEFSEASWDSWRADVHGAADHLLSLSGAAPLILWGLRLGALLAAQVAGERNDVSRLLLWQPVLNGEQQVDQFLRLQVVSDALKGADSFDRAALWVQLRDGHNLEIAGYELTPELALPMSNVRLATLEIPCPVDWLDVAALAGDGLSVAGQRVVDQWRDQGAQVHAQRVVGQPFWRNLDASASAQLYEATESMLGRPV